MLALFTAQPDTLIALRRFGVDARLAKAGDQDQDHDALVLVNTDVENLAQLTRWVKGGGQASRSVGAVIHSQACPLLYRRPLLCHGVKTPPGTLI